MPELFLVRHAQASLGQDNYDRLSELGHRQSRWLGEYFAELDIRFDRIMTGAMRRHRETAEGIAAALGCGADGFDVHPEWNEYDFLTLLRLYQDQCPVEPLPPGATRKQMYRMLHKALLAWAVGEIDCGASVMETWPDFQARVHRMLEMIRVEHGRKILVVSSGGALAIAVQHVLKVPNENTIQLNLQTRNTALHHCFLSESSMSLSSFNAVPHLETAARHQYITHA